MHRFVNVLRAGLLGTTALVAVSGAATAADLSFKDEPAAEEARKWGVSFTAAAVTDYIFRGISQTDEDPTLQASVDVTYGIAYFGIWGSGIDFGPSGTNGTPADVEIDVYAGIKPTYKNITFDIGGIYYYYPGADDVLAETDYFEFKLGASGNVMETLAAGVTIYYSPEFTGEVGGAVAIEGTLTKTLPSMGRFGLAISSTVGYQHFEEEDKFDLNSYVYGNIGITATAGKLSLDVRYWDTDLDSDELPAGASVFQADERVVGTLKVTLP